MRRGHLFGGLVFLFLLVSGPVMAGMALPLTLRQMTDQAGRIFLGRCLGTDEELDEYGLPATFLRFEVLEGLKGAREGELLLIKQFGAAPRRLPRTDGESVALPLWIHPPAVASCEAGEESLLFLYPESSHGFSSPVGLGQGKFLIRLEEDGSRKALPALSLPGSQARAVEEMMEEVRRILEDR